MNKIRKIIQISTSLSTEDVERVALCDDGTVWEYVWAKPIYKDIPPTPTKQYSSKEKIGMTEATWIKLADIPQGEM